jgi:hypothetical protein
MPHSLSTGATPGRLLPARALLLATIWACGSRARPPGERAGLPRSDSVAALASSQDTMPFQGTSEPLRLVRQFVPPATVHGVFTSRESGFDRIVFEFAGDSVPGYAVAYSDGEVHRCGSGDPVVLAGTDRLLIRLEPAQAHDERGQPTVLRREWAPALPVVQQLAIVCDFEGQVEWALGLAVRRPYRVLTALRPTRIIVDVRHRD